MCYNQLAENASQIGAELLGLRKQLGLPRSAAASLLGVDPQTIFRWEKGEREPGADAYLKAKRAYEAELAKRGIGQVAENSPPFDVGDAPEARFPFAQVMRTPAVRARLAAFRTEIVDMGASEDGEERLVAKLRDRQTINDFVGGRDEDRYSEREIIRVIDNYARILKDLSKELGMP